MTAITSKPTATSEKNPARGDEARVVSAMAAFVAEIGPRVSSYMNACVRCGLCAEACHFHVATGEAKYAPILKIKPFEDAYKRSKAPFGWLAKMLGEAPRLRMDDLREWEELVFDSCTMCGRCTLVCPMGIDIAAMVGEARTGFSAAGLGPADLVAAATNSRDHYSPLGLTPEKLSDRLDWLSDDNDTPMPLDKPEADVLLTVSSIEAMKYPQSIAAVAKVLNHAGVDWTFSSKGYEATNFGYFAGDVEIEKLMLTRIVEAAESVGAKTLVIPECGHAYGVMRWGGANVLGRPLPFEVLHISEFMARLKRDGKLKLKPLTESITYHDPCQISRRGGATAAARYLLDDFAEDFREMAPTGELNWCCGGGGGVQAVGRAIDLRHQAFRIKMDQVDKTGAGMMVSSCANCRLTFDEDKTFWKWETGLGSLVEIIADHLIEEPEPAPAAKAADTATAKAPPKGTGKNPSPEAGG